MLIFAKFATFVSLLLCGLCMGSMVLHATDPGPHGSVSWDSLLAALSSFGGMAWAVLQLVATLGIAGRPDAGRWRAIAAVTLVCLVGCAVGAYLFSET